MHDEKKPEDVSVEELHALEQGPIAELATKIYNGIPIDPISAQVVNEHPTKGKLTLRPWPKKIHPEIAMLTIGTFFKLAYDAGQYSPQKDMIIMPQKTGCGVDGLNNYIASHLAKAQCREVFEIIVGRNKRYLSVGDLVLVNGECAKVIRIVFNHCYQGRKPQQKSVNLDYWGHFSSESESAVVGGFGIETIEEFLDAAVVSCNEEGSSAPSHVITLKMIESGEEIVFDTSAKIETFALSYALTLDQFQGLKWDNVFLILHQSHSAMLNRAWLYAAVTRAKKQLYVICEPDAFSKVIVSTTGVTSEHKN